MDLTEFLQTTAIFEGFSQAELGVLEQALRVDRFPADSVLLEEGHKGYSLFILMDGEIQVSHKHRVGRGIDYLGILRAGELFGLQSMISDLPPYATYTALTPVQVASLPQTAFRLLYNSHIALAEHFQFLIARQLVQELRRLDAGIVASVTGGKIGPLHMF